MNGFVIHNRSAYRFNNIALQFAREKPVQVDDWGIRKIGKVAR